MLTKLISIGQLPIGFGQLPGNSLESKCFDASKESNTQPLPLRLFENENTISSNDQNIEIGDLLVQVYTIPIGQGDCNNHHLQWREECYSV